MQNLTNENDDGFDLTFEQQFTVASHLSALPKMSREQLEDLYIKVLKLAMIRENAIKKLVKDLA